MNQCSQYLSWHSPFVTWAWHSLQLCLTFSQAKICNIFWCMSANCAIFCRFTKPTLQNGYYECQVMLGFSYLLLSPAGIESSSRVFARPNLICISSRNQSCVCSGPQTWVSIRPNSAFNGRSELVHSFLPNLTDLSAISRWPQSTPFGYLHSTPLHFLHSHKLIIC